MAVSIFKNTLLDLITTIPVDCKTYELHSPSVTACNFALEDGSKVTDHVILNPMILEIEFVLSNRDIPFGSVPASYGLRAALLYTLLLNNLKHRGLYTVLTRHQLYTNMCLIEMPSEHVGPYTGALTCRAKFQQIRKAKLSGVNIPQSQLEDDPAYKAASSINFGNVPTKTLTSDNKYYEPILTGEGI
jgi:hypothetical protein